MALTKPGEKACAFPDCPNPVEPDDHCHGCKFYICEEHSKNYSLMGPHEVVEHWCFDDDEED